jgi:hypothetical protein
MRLKRLCRAGASIILLYALSADAVLVPTLDLDKLTADATLITVGQVTLLREVEKATVQLGNRTVPARAMVAELHVDHVLKGINEASSLTIHFVIPDEFVGWRPVTLPSYRVFFLAGTSSELRLSNPYYPSLAAIPGADIQEGTTIERVIGQLGAVLESAKSPVEERREAVFALNSSKSPAAVGVLRRVAEVKDVTLRLSVAAALLEHNDISTLQFAEQTLLKPDPTLSPDLLHNLSYAIFVGVKDERAVPGLTRLLHASSLETRRAAASALMHVGSTSCIDPLLSAIGDPDFEVRYYSVVGLAEITGQMDWRPNMEDFRSDQDKYLKHWRVAAP